MKENHNEGFFDSKEMEQWLDQFFLDPYTAYLDETVFRIDLYDSESAFIVEALLPFVKKNDIDISVSANTLQIKVKQTDKNDFHKTHIKTRTVTFPIPISQLKMTADYEHDILEIQLLKETKSP